MMKKELTIGTLLLLALGTVLAACGSAQPSARLDGSAWVLKSLNGRSPLEGTEITLAFDGGQASGSSGCNTYSGPYTIEGAEGLAFRELANTEMGCLEPNGIMEQETEYLQTLRAATSFRLTDGQLEISSAGGGLLTYDPTQ